MIARARPSAVFVAFASMALAVGVAGVAGAQAADSKPIVLLLHSYHRADWSIAVNAGVESILGKGDEVYVPGRDGLPVAYSFRLEYMDTKRIETPEYLAELARLYALKYGGQRIAAIIAVDDYAYRFALSSPEAFGDAPVFFCGVNSPRPEIHAGRAHGVMELADFKPTLRFAMDLFPDASTIVLIEDDTDTAEANSAEFLRVAAETFPGIEVERTLGLSLDGLKAILLSDAPRTFAFFNAFWRDGSGAPVSVDELSAVFSGSAIPIFGRSPWMIGRGLIGGLCVIGEEQGAAAAKLAYAYLAGESMGPEILESPNRFMFDFAVLSRFGKHDAALPAGSILLNAPMPFLKRYGTVAIPLGIFALSTLAVAFILWLSIARLRETGAELKQGLAEKEMLLKEIHHRVKNNLQVMKSLFSLQKSDAPPEVGEAFDAASSRLQAMAMVHDRLYRDGKLGAIDLLEYARDLAAEVASVYSAGSRYIRIGLEGECMFISIEHAVAVGLFLNEALTNAVKYGLPRNAPCAGSRENPSDAASIAIRIGHEDSQARVSVIDPGDGFEFDGRNDKGLGLVLMKAMAEQLRGRIESDRASGFMLSLIFPMEPC